MAQFYLIPNWFFGFSIAAELIFGLVTLLVSIYSFKVYNYCIERECKLFGWAFLSLSLSYFSWALVSWYVLQGVTGPEVFEIGKLNLLVSLGAYSHVIFFLLGLSTLAYMALNVKSPKVFTLITSLVLIVPIFSFSKIISLYFVSSLLLLYVLIYYFKKYKTNFNQRTLFTFIGFIFIFLGSADFTFSAINHVPYVVGHAFFMIGYLFMTINFLLSFRASVKRK